MPSRPRLLSVGSIPPEWGGARRGGVATFHATLLEQLLAGDLGIEVVGVIEAQPPTRPGPVPVLGPLPGQNRKEFLTDALSRLQPDIIVLHHFATHDGLLLPELAPEIPLVGVAHSWHTITFAPEGGEEIARTRTRESLTGLSVIVFVSDHCRREGLRLGFEYPRTQATIYLPVDDAFRAPLELNGPRRGAVFLGTLERRKRPDMLIEAVALIGELPLTMIGNGPEAARLEASIGRLGLEHRVSIDSDVPAPDASPLLRALLSGAEVMCMPSISETFGIAYIEALACGTPVIGFPPTLAEIETEAGIRIGLAYGDGPAAELAGAIEQVRASEWDREELRAQTLRTFSAPRVAERYAELLLAVLGA